MILLDRKLSKSLVPFWVEVNEKFSWLLFFCYPTPFVDFFYFFSEEKKWKIFLRRKKIAEKIFGEKNCRGF